MGENYILLDFNHDSYIDFRKGSYIIYEGFKFEIMTDFYPEMYRNGWKYSLQFDAKEGLLRKYNIFYRKQGIQEVAFALTTDLLSFGNVICDCINHELGGANWRVKAIPTEYADLMKTLSFKGEKLFDALTMVAQQFECEWWIEENGNFVDLCFGKLSFGTEEEFEEGKVVTSIPRKAGDDSDFGTRFFVYGSTRNLTSDYGQVEQGGTTNHISEIRLRLPNGLNYIDAWENLSPEDVVHQVVFFDDVYPKNTDVITKVETAPREIKGSENKETFDAYIITAGNSPFVPSDLIEGETFGCVFETGALQGQRFELKINEKYNPDSWKPSDGFDKKFEIVHVMNGDIIVPNKSFKPEVGDKFVITGVRLPKERIKEAEQELLQVGQAWAKKKSQDTSVYDCPTNPVFCQENEKNYDLGQKVKLVGDRFGVSGRSSRIQGYEKKLWNEYEATYTVGDNSSYSRLKQIEGEIKESQYSERIGVANGVGIYLIRNKFDNTQPTNYNAYSALASLEKFVTYAGYVNQPVRTIDDVRFKSISSPEFASGLTGTGYRINEEGYAELTGLTLREFLEAPEYRFNRVDVVSGEQWNAPGFGLIESVDVENCIATLKLEDQELAGIRVGDLCRGLFHNLAGNADGAVTDSCGFLTVAGFSTSYFTPVELLEDGKSFRYELKPGTAVHPSPAMKFAVYGNFTDKSRQASAYSTRTYKRYLKEVNTWEIDPQRNIAMQFGDLSGLYINGVDMSGYSAWLNNIYFSGHAEWTPGQLEEIRGKDGYSVNLTSYDAVVAVDSQGRIDNSVYDIINVVNGSELVQSAGMQVVTTRYKIQTEIQAYRGQVRLEHSDSPGEGVYTAAFTAEGCEYSFAAGVLTVTKITGDKASVEIEVNCEGAATFTMKFVLTRVYGGEAGPEGMISRVSEWAEGFYYRNDTETETGSLRYLDIVVVTDRSTGNFACYQAKAAHNGVASSELNRPGNEAFWTRMSQLPPIYTPLILAENGVIRFAQSNQLLIQKEDGTVTAGMSGAGTGAGGIRIWAGGSVPDSAPFRVDEDGKMVADNAEITGTIKAIDGSIGGFKIADNKLTVGNGSEGVTLSPTYISLVKQQSYISTIVNKIQAELGEKDDFDSYPPFKFYKRKTSLYDKTYIPTMEIISDNATNINVALKTTGNIVSRDAVIEGGFARVNFDQYTVLNLRYGTKYEIYNAGDERFFYFPEVGEVKNMLGSLPVSIVVDVIAHHATTAKFYLKFTSGGTIYDRGGNAVDSYGMSRGNSVSFLLVYESATSYYAQIMQQNY